MESVPCNPDTECKYRDTERGCYQDVDHYYHPAYKYRDSVSKAFRELVIHKTLTCRQLHDNRHASEAPPPKPKRSEMLRIINEQS